MIRVVLTLGLSARFRVKSLVFKWQLRKSCLMIMPLCPPIGTMGFGRNSVSSRNRALRTPHRITTFIGGRLTAPNQHCQNIQGYFILW